MSQLNIVFAGTPEFGLPCLAALQQSSHHLQAVYSQPDRPAGRGRKLQASAVKNWAMKQGIPVFQPLNFKEQATVDELTALAPDVLVVIAYGLILPKRVLAIPKYGCINVHASLLPRWRGASPIQQAILSGDKETGVTIMQMDAGMDTGDSLYEVSCPIADDDTAGSLHDKLAAMSAEPLLATLSALSSGKLKPKPQDSSLATYAGKITKEAAAINWHQSVNIIDQQIRAFNPWPIAYTEAKGVTIRIHQATIAAKNTEAEPGTLLAMDKTGIYVATQDGVLCIKRLQLPGGKVISVADYLNAGREQLFTGLVFQ